MTRKQRRQRNDSKLYTFGGKTQTLREWAEELDITTSAIRKRMASGMPPEILFSKDRRIGENYGKHKQGYFRKLEREVNDDDK